MFFLLDFSVGRDTFSKKRRKVSTMEKIFLLLVLLPALALCEFLCQSYNGFCKKNVKPVKLEFRLAYPNDEELRTILTDVDSKHEEHNKKNQESKISKEDFYKNIYRPAHPELAEYDLLYTIDDAGRRNYDLISTKVEMTGGIKKASVGRTFFGQLEIQLEFNSEGAKQFGKVTTANVGKRLGIVLDGQLYAAPYLNEPILGGRAQITGNFTEEEAEEIAAGLTAGK